MELNRVVRFRKESLYCGIKLLLQPIRTAFKDRHPTYNDVV